MATEDSTWADDGSSAMYDPAGPTAEQSPPVSDDAASEKGGNNNDGEEEVSFEEADEDEEEEDADDGGEYDPESVGLVVTEPEPDKSASGTPSQRPVSKPKMSGGFLVEASDDEDDDNATPSAAIPQISASNGQRKNGSTPGLATDLPGGAPPSMAGVDPIALFEVRIQEDPRGDMDAWLHLMAEQRRRSQLEELRRVYGRFLEVFPQAVS